MRGGLWLRIVVTSIAVSLLLHFLVPPLLQLLKQHLRVNVPGLQSLFHLVKDNPSTSLLDYPSRERRRFHSNDVAYFPEPFPSFPWRVEEEEEEEDNGGVVRRLPSPSPVNRAPELEQEALAALSAAMAARESGRLRRAESIIEHALALAPRHPDILIEYGLFIEASQKNIIQAETMYTRALAICPGHTVALSHRRRTQPLVEELDRSMLAAIDRQRQLFHKIPRGNAALRRAMRDSYFEHVYHTVAMEGSTMTLTQTRSILETRIAVGGKSILEHNEILGMDAALRYLNRSLVHVGSITLQDILEMHRRVLGFCDPITAGVFRSGQVYVGEFTPVAASQVAGEMETLIEWLNSEQTLTMHHPVELAAIAHYKLVLIHPFIDGNGRTARLLMNLILMQAAFPPVIVPVEERLRYYETLKLANEGDLRPFVRLIAEQTQRTLQAYLNAAGTCDTTDCAPEITSDSSIPSY